MVDLIEVHVVDAQPPERRVGDRLLDARRRLRWLVTGAALAAMAVSFIPIGVGGARLGGWSLALLVFGTLLMDACVQATHVVNQSVIYDLLPAARSRLTTIYMTAYFIGGAVGSAAGAQAYKHAGWAGQRPLRPFSRSSASSPRSLTGNSGAGGEEAQQRAASVP